MTSKSLVFLGAFLLVSFGTRAQSYVAELDGRNQLPSPINTDMEALFILEVVDNTTASWELVITNPVNYTMSHIHQGSASENGNPVVLLDPSSPLNFSALPMLSPPITAEIYEISGKFTAADFGLNWTGLTMTEAVEQIISGNAYVNIHTIQEPAGEIRGQLDLFPTPSAAAKTTVTVALFLAIAMFAA